jgi:hypothetical protein
MKGFFLPAGCDTLKINLMIETLTYAYES